MNVLGYHLPLLITRVTCLLLFRLYVPGDIVSNPKKISSTFVYDCVDQGKLLDIKQYRWVFRYVVVQVKEILAVVQIYWLKK